MGLVWSSLKTTSTQVDQTWDCSGGERMASGLKVPHAKIRREHGNIIESTTNFNDSSTNKLRWSPSATRNFNQLHPNITNDVAKRRSGRRLSQISSSLTARGVTPFIFRTCKGRHRQLVNDPQGYHGVTRDIIGLPWGIPLGF